MAAPKGCKVVVALPLAQPLLDQLAENDLVVQNVLGHGYEAFKRALAVAQGALVSSNVLVDRDTISSSPDLRVISTMSVGVDHIDLEAARERGVMVTITPVLSDAVADLTMTLVVMLSRRIVEGMRAVNDGKWSATPLGASVAGKRLLIVGFGRIGQAVAKRALAAGLWVTFVDNREDLPQSPGVDRATSLHAGLPDADFVSLHVDLNAETRHLMGRDEFMMMKRSAFLVNTSRGGVVDQVALTSALAQGAIGGAGLDVLEEEPPGADEPLLEAPNVIIVPHIGSATIETRAAMAQCAVDNLLKALRYEAVPFVVT